MAMTKWTSFGGGFLTFALLLGGPAVAQQAGAQKADPSATKGKIIILKDVQIQKTQPGAERVRQVELEMEIGPLQFQLVPNPPKKDGQQRVQVWTFQIQPAIVFSPDRRHFAKIESGKVRLIEAATGKVVWETPVPPEASIAFSRDGKSVAISATMKVPSLPKAEAKPRAEANPSEPTLRALLKSSDPEVRRLAAELLARMERAQAEKALQAAKEKEKVRRLMTLQDALIRKAWQMKGKSPRNKETEGKGIIVKPAPANATLEQRLDRLTQDLQKLTQEVLDIKKQLQKPKP